MPNPAPRSPIRVSRSLRAHAFKMRHGFAPLPEEEPILFAGRIVRTAEEREHLALEIERELYVSFPTSRGKDFRWDAMPDSPKGQDVRGLLIDGPRSAAGVAKFLGIERCRSAVSLLIEGGELLVLKRRRQRIYHLTATGRARFFAEQRRVA